MKRSIYVTEEEFYQMGDTIMEKMEALLVMFNEPAMEEMDDLWRYDRVISLMDRLDVYTTRAEKRKNCGKKIKRSQLLKMEKCLDKAIKVLGLK